MNYILMDASRLNMLQVCPQKFKYIYEDNLRRINEKPYFEKGTLLHKMFHVYYGCLKYRQRWYLTEFNYNKLIELCIKVGEFFGVRGNIEIEELESIVNSFRQYSEFYKNDIEFTKNEIVCLEQYFAKPLLEPFEFENEEYQIVLEGRIDLIYLNDEGKPVVVDYKSESRKGTFSSIRNQFLVYPWSSGSRKLTVNVIGLQKSLKPEDKFYRKSFQYTDELIEEFEIDVLYNAQQYLKYKSTNYWPRNRCSCDIYGICDFESICSSVGDLRSIRLERDFKKFKWDVFKV